MSKKFSISLIDDTIYIRTTELGKPKAYPIKGLNGKGIKISNELFNKYFNKTFKQFKPTSKHPEFEIYNLVIQKELKKYESSNYSISSLSTENKSFLVYANSLIDKMAIHGTQIKNQVVVAKLKNFLQANQFDDLLFKDITPDFLRDFNKYLLQTKSPKKLSPNSANHYIKMIRKIFKKASLEYSYNVDPFKHIEFNKNTKKETPVVDLNEINRLIETAIENPTISGARDMFLFALFSNGMRVSDLLTLRWNNLVGNRIKYTMYKNGQEAGFPISVRIMEILAKIVGVPGRLQRFQQMFRIPYVEINNNVNENEVANITLNEMNEKIAEKILRVPEKYSEAENIFFAKVQSGEIKEYNGCYIENDNYEYVVRLIKHYERCSEDVDFEFLDLTKNRIIINYFKTGKQNQFIFPYLNNELYSNIETNKFRDNLNLKQYKAIKNATIVYNRHLKLVMKACNITTNISSHVARHSFANILVREHINPFHIKLAMVHQDIKTTSVYIDKSFTKGIADYTTKRASDATRKPV